MKPAIQAFDIKANQGGEQADENDPTLGPHKKLGPYASRALGDHFGLTLFGVDIDTLAPGSKSSVRHWHSQTDEFVFVLEGELILITEEGETKMSQGMVAGFKGGEENGHHLVNRSDAPASFLIVGSRGEGDKVTYPDDDLTWLQDEEGKWFAAHKDGLRY